MGVGVGRPTAQQGGQLQGLQRLRPAQAGEGCSRWQDTETLTMCRRWGALVTGLPSGQGGSIQMLLNRNSN